VSVGPGAEFEFCIRHQRVYLSVRKEVARCQQEVDKHGDCNHSSRPEQEVEEAATLLHGVVVGDERPGMR